MGTGTALGTGPAAGPESRRACSGDGWIRPDAGDEAAATAAGERVAAMALARTGLALGVFAFTAGCGDLTAVRGWGEASDGIGSTMSTSRRVLRNGGPPNRLSSAPASPLRPSSSQSTS